MLKNKTYVVAFNLVMFWTLLNEKISNYIYHMGVILILLTKIVDYTYVKFYKYSFDQLIKIWI